MKKKKTISSVITIGCNEQVWDENSSRRKYKNTVVLKTGRFDNINLSCHHQQCKQGSTEVKRVMRIIVASISVITLPRYGLQNLNLKVAYTVPVLEVFM